MYTANHNPNHGSCALGVWDGAAVSSTQEGMCRTAGPPLLDELCLCIVFARERGMEARLSTSTVTTTIEPRWVFFFCKCSVKTSHRTRRPRGRSINTASMKIETPWVIFCRCSVRHHTEREGRGNTASTDVETRWVHFCNGRCHTEHSKLPRALWPSGRRLGSKAGCPR